eukprot:m51a1_g7891 hypothetical protein (220) ;mRNA; f:89140-90155
MALAWETRLFWRKGAGEDDAKLALEGAELRTDVYIDLGEPDLGLKLRSWGRRKQEMELKVRSDRRNGGEAWAKPVRAPSQLRGSAESVPDLVELRSLAAEALAGSQERVAAARRALGLLPEALAACYVLDKARVQRPALVGAVQCSYEVAVFRARRTTAAGEVVDLGEYVSVCAEGGSDAVLPSGLVAFSHAPRNAMVMGFPEFIARLARSNGASTSSH